MKYKKSTIVIKHESESDSLKNQTVENFISPEQTSPKETVEISHRNEILEKSFDKERPTFNLKPSKKMTSTRLDDITNISDMINDPIP